MVRRHVEQLEVVLVRLDLAAPVNLETQIGEDGVDLAQGLRRQVEPAARHRPAGQRHVQRLLRQGLFQGALFQAVRLRLIRLDQPFLDAIGFLAVGAPLSGRHLGHFLDGQEHLALLAEVARVPGAQGCLVGASVQLGACFLLKGAQV